MARFMRLLLLIAAVITAAGCTSPSTQFSNERENGGNGVIAADVESVILPEAPDITAYKVKYFEPGEVVVEQTAVFEDDKPFTITGYGPVDFLPAEVKQPSIYVTFSQPVVPLARLGEPSGESGVLTIDPPLSGVFRWYGTRLLSFDASEEVIPQREYTVRVAPSIRSLGGKALSGERDFSFRTEPLSMERIIPGTDPDVYLSEVPPEAAGNITLLFNHPVNPDVVTAYLEVFVDNRPAAFSFDRRFPENLELETDVRERALVIRVKEQIAEQTAVEIVLNEGARSEEDYIGSPSVQKLSLTTLSAFRFYDYDTYSWTFPTSPEGSAYPVFLSFSHPVDPDGIEKHVTLMPKTEISPDSINVWGNQIKISGLPFPPESTYRIVLSPDLRDIYGRDLGEEISVKIQVPPAESYAYFQNTGSRMLEAEFPHKIVYEYQNIFDGVWKIDRITDPYSSFRPEELEPYDFSGVEKNVRHFEMLDLDPWLNIDGKGAVGISWNFEEKDKKGNRPTWGQRNLQLQVTDLALTARIAHNRVLVLVTSISTGDPVAGAEVSLMRDREVKFLAETDETGIAEFDLELGDYNRHFQDFEQAWRDHLRIRAEYGYDAVEFIPNNSHNPYRSGVYSVSGPLYAGQQKMVSYLFTDRGLYRPGEKVWFRGIDLDLQYGNYSPYQGLFTAALSESGYGAPVIDSLEGYTSAAGGFYGAFDLPDAIAPGYYSISYTRPNGQSSNVYLQVAYFENLNFEVEITGSDTLYYLGDAIEFKVHAEYLSGGNLSGGRSDLYWSKEPITYSPPGNDTYSFCPLNRGQRFFLSSGEGELNSSGTIYAEQRTTVEGVAGMPYNYRLEARVQDAGRQEISADKTALVHPASFYIGGRIVTDMQSAWSTFVSKGEELSVSWMLVDPGGEPYRRMQAGRTLTAGLYRVDWKLAQQQGVAGMVTTRYERIEELEDEVRIDGGDFSGSIAFTPTRGGLYLVRLSSADEEGRAVVTELDFYATGADWIRWGGDGSMIELLPDGDSFTPGETANILVKSPLPEGRYMITVEREGIMDEYLIDLEGSAQVIGVPVREEYIPVVYVSVASYSVRAGEPTHTYFTPDLDKPKGYYGVAALPVDTSAVKIDVNIDTGGITYLPGGKAEVVLVATKGDEPVPGAEITFMAVDRGVVDLIDYHVPDPLEFFYSQSNFPLCVSGADSRSLLIDPVTYEVRDKFGGDAGDEKGGDGIRSNFVPTAVFEPFLITDEDGIARVVFTLPDTLTTYRCTAVASKDASFGFSEEELRVQQPINVTSLLPGRIRVRDTINAGVMLTNMDRKTHEVTIGVESELVKVDGESSKTITLESGDTREVTFNLYSEVPGDTEVVFRTTSDVLKEALVRPLTVELPSVRETVTTTGRVEADTSPVTEGIVIPGYESVRDGNIRIEISPSLLSGLLPAVDYLLEYPHDCFEQRASRLMPVVLFGPAVVDNPEEVVSRELNFWAEHQMESGGFPFWPEYPYQASYYVTLRIAHVLKIAEEKGFNIPGGIDTRRMISFLARPDEWVESNDYLMLYSLYVQSLYGVPVHRQASDFESESGGLDHASHAFLGLAFSELRLSEKAQSALEDIIRYVKPGTRSVDLTPKRSSSRWFYGGTDEQLSLLLMLLTAVDPGSDLADRIAGSLLLARSRGAWRNTAATNWALLALSQLMEERDDASGEVAASVTIGEDQLYSGRFTGIKESAKVEIDFDEEPVASMKRDTLLPLEFSADGSLYYTASLAYDLPAETAGARDQGFSVYTSLETADGKTIAGNVLAIGETYRQRVFVSTSRTRSYSAITVPVPSGAEILDTSFATTGSYEADGPEYGYWQRPVEKIYDNKVVYYFDDLEPGSVEVVFLFRAVSRGVFPTPPVTAECMYEPEVFGRSGGRLLIFAE